MLLHDKSRFLPKRVKRNAFLHSSSLNEIISLDIKHTHTQSLLVYSRSLLAPSDYKSISESGVHGEDGSSVSFGHHTHKEVIPPDVYVTVDGASKGQVILHHTNTHTVTLC